MDRTELRAAQAPLRRRYRDDPAAALTPLSARGDYRDEGVTATVPVRAAELRAESSFDARGTLGLDPTAPVGVGEVTVTAELDTDADDTTLDKLAAATEKYCVVGQSLATTPRFVVRRRH